MGRLDRNTTGVLLLTNGGVLACIGVARGPKWLAYAGVALAALGVLVFIIAFIRAWRALRREQKRKGGPER